MQPYANCVKRQDIVGIYCVSKQAIILNRSPEGDSIRVIDESPVVANDPGMSNANMKSVTIVVDDIDENAPPPLQELDEGEHILRHLVPLKDLHKKILGVYLCLR